MAVTSAHPRILQKSHSGRLGLVSSWIFTEPASVTDISPRGVGGCAGDFLRATLFTSRLGGQNLSEPALLGEGARSAVAGEKQHAFTHYHMPVCYHNYKNGENWAGVGGRRGGTDKLKMDSLLGSSSVRKVFRLVARNKHFSVTDFTDFLKILFFHSLLKYILFTI